MHILNAKLKVHEVGWTMTSAFGNMRRIGRVTVVTSNGRKSGPVWRVLKPSAKHVSTMKLNKIMQAQHSVVIAPLPISLCDLDVCKT